MQTFKFLHQNSRFLSFGFLMAFLSSFGQTYVFGAYKVNMMADLGLSNSEFGFWYLLITIGSAVGLNFLGGHIDHMPLKKWTLRLVVCMIITLFLLYFSPFFSLTILALIFIRLIGQGLFVHTSTTSMSRYFLTGRGKALSIAMLGIPLGQALLPYLATLTQQAMSWQQSWLLIGVGFLTLSIPLTMFFLKDHDKRHECWVEATTTSNSEQEETAQHKRRRDVIKDYRFYLLIPNFLAIPFWVTAVFFFASDIALIKNISMADFTSLYVFNGVSAILAPFIMGSLVDKYGGKPFLLLAAPILSIALLICIYMQSLTGAGIFFFVLGFSMGVSIPVNNSVWAELYGTRYLGEIKALSVSIVVLSTALSPWLIGLFLEMQMSIITILWAGVIHSLLAIPLLIPVMRSDAHKA
ncbi:MFS transporter [Temperatibacter marinus]|uniref:MFS transporter n=1 Tax=Temperatibacter marinus TaxID=1456591 RepID=A0AA52EIY6_9PROT|nr:MFS transporter [Temperatibacter marinus]WND03387.1 MFS transporter [Temperatibacter marinus]